MRLPLLLALTLAALPVAADLESEQAAQVTAARAILDPWHAENPERGVRKLHLVYWTPSDRDPATDHEARLTRMMEHIRAFYATEMQRLGFGPRTVNLDYDRKGKLIIHLVKGAGPYASYGMQSGAAIRRECLPVLREAGINADRETIVIFCNMAEWDPEKLVFKHRSPYYAGGSHRQGTAWQLDSPELDPLHLSKKQPMIRDGQYGRISLGKHNSIFIGGVAHELGHALSLPHNRERPDERAAFGTALMGSGNRSYGDELRQEGKGSFLTFAHGLRLASHPQFSGSVKGIHRPASTTLTNFAVEPTVDGFRFSGRVVANPPAYAIIGYCDPEGGSDYNATTATAVPAADGTFTLHCQGLARGAKADLRLVVCHVNGDSSPRTRYSFAYQVEKDGAVDLGTMQQRFALLPLVKALNANDEDAVAAASRAIPATAGDKASRIANRLIASRRGAPGSIPPSALEEGPTCVLADAKPTSQRVGWHRPSYNRVPKESLLLESGNRLWEHGIYAHAPARHVYELGGRWKTLRGSCGVADGHPGSVVFLVKTDGKERWRSKTLKAGSIATYDLALESAKELELVVEDAGDGNGADWGLWLEPTLAR